MEQNILEHLNTSQAQAARHPEGPLLIVAGAGTGKTRVITAKIVHLLTEKKVPAKEILALTFTEKAAEEMVARLDEAMPLSYEEVMIKTFHGFCDVLLRERGMEIGIDPGFEVLSQAGQWLFLKRHLFELKLDYYRPLGNPYKFLHVLLGHFSRLKDEDVRPEAYVAHAQKLIDEAQKGNREQGDSTSEAGVEDATKMLEIAQAYAMYGELMMKQNYLDFGDLQYFALRLLEQRATVLTELQEQYKYILVDEFQDTNFAQNKLVMQLAGKHKNLTVVGDDDQSIYRWRGASLSNIQLFEERFPQADRVVLTENYRSRQDILDASYALIQQNNPQRLEVTIGIDKKLQAAQGDGTSSEAGVRVWQFGQYNDEVRHVVSQVQELLQKGVRYSDIAVLTRSHQQAVPFLEALKDAGVPFAVKDTQGLLRFDEIKDLVAVVRFLAKPHDDVAFFRLLSMEVFGIDMADILQLAQEARKAHFEPLFYFLRKKFDQNIQGELPGIAEPSPFEDFYKLTKELLHESRRLGTERLLGEFLQRSGYIQSLTKHATVENEEKIIHIGQLLTLAKDFDVDSIERPLQSFLEYLDSLAEAPGGLAVTGEEESDAVAVLTVHAAKGLEFDYVFLPALVQHRFPSVSKRDPLPIPEELLEEHPPEANHLAEERRLFYVACTRARKGLLLSYSERYEGKKQWKPSVFVQEILDSGHAKMVESSQPLTAEKIVEESRPADDLFSAYNLTIPVHQLSYSKIDTFLTCPLKYKFRYGFQVPTPQGHAANFGSSVHNTVNAFYGELKAGQKPSLERLKELYEQYWISGGYESRGHENTRKKQGWEMMERFYAKEAEVGFKVPAFLERAFRLKIGNVLYTGRIDRIDELADGSYEVIDYKTGTSKRDINLDKDLQLSLYALACKEVFGLKVASLSLYYLEDAVKASTKRGDEDLTALREELAEITGQLRKAEFEPTPGFHCRFCDYRLLCYAAE